MMVSRIYALYAKRVRCWNDHRAHCANYIQTQYRRLTVFAKYCQHIAFFLLYRAVENPIWPH
jgi:hypothetical protein